MLSSILFKNLILEDTKGLICRDAVIELEEEGATQMYSSSENHISRCETED